MISVEAEQQVSNFLACFTQLKNYSDDDPFELMKLCCSDDSVVELCAEIYASYKDIKDENDLNSSAYIHSISKNFINFFRDYENRYHLACTWGSLCGEDSPGAGSAKDIIQLYVQNKDVYARHSSLINPSHINKGAWEIADEDADLIFKKIGYSIECSREFTSFFNDKGNADFRNYFFDWYGQDFAECVELAPEGTEFLSNMKDVYDIDLQGIIRRKSLAPLILVQSKSSHGSHSSLQISLFSILNQAHKAFIFGLNFASISMLRSTLEVILRDHYKLGGTSSDGRPVDLLQMINDSYSKLPKDIGPMHLHKLRIKANSILHVSPKNVEGESSDPIMALEIEVLEYLHTIRRLIEELR